MGDKKQLGEFEQLLLLTLQRLGPSAYGASIRRELIHCANRNVSIGAVYTTLDRMERKGYVSSRQGAATPQRGGRSKRLFRIQAEGAKALNESLQAIQRLGGFKLAGSPG